MAWFSRARRARSSGPILVVEKLDVYYGRAHALQEVSLSLDHGVTAVVGRNGMGKTTLCNAITGLVPASGSVRLDGEEILGLPPNAITDRGVGYVPQGRRVWPSLTVDEHLRLASRDRSRGPWTVARVYQTFPRLAERKGNGGAELSGGEQQMLAIARALLFNPMLLVMDEPTEGLAPVIVQQVAEMLKRLAADGVHLGAADRAEPRRGDRRGRHRGRDGQRPHRALDAVGRAGRRPRSPAAPARRQGRAWTRSRATPRGPRRGDAAGHGDRLHGAALERRGGTGARRRRPSRPAERAVRGFTRWNAGDPRSAPRDRLLDGRADPGDPVPSLDEASAALADSRLAGRVVEFPVAATVERAAYIAGTFDTKGRELFFLRNCLDKLGLRTVTVDLATSGKPSPAMIHPREVARHHPRGERAVFTGDRGSAVSEMAVAFEQFVAGRRDLGGLISAGGSGGTALATLAMRGLPIGLPKVMVSTVASGDVKPYVGPSDICMMYSVTDVAGINRISERVLANAAHALAGMIAYGRALDRRLERQARDRPHQVRGDHAVRAGGDQGARGALRLPRLPRHRDRRPVHGEARGLGPAGRGDRRHHHRDRGRDRGRRALRGARAPRRDHPHAAALRRLVRRARHGELLGDGDGARPVPRPQPVPAQPQRDAHAHDPRGVRAHRPLHRREAQPHGRARCGS